MRTILPTLLLCSLATLASAQDPAPAKPAEDALPEKITLPPSEESAPTVNIRSIENGDTVEEYRENGRLTMVKVRPKVGPAYTFVDSNGDGKLDRRDSDAPVAPVYWTLYEWN